MMNLSSLSKARFWLMAVGALVVVSAVLSVARGSFSYESLLIIGALTVSLFYVQKTRNEIARTMTVCKALARGDFSARLTRIREKGDIGEFQWAVNEMTDYTNAFVREATASMEYVSRNRYFRRIWEDGLHGNLLSGARIINMATKSVAEKMNGFMQIANDFDASLKDVAQGINSAVVTLRGTADTMVGTVDTARQGANAAVQKSDVTSQNVQTISAAAEEMSSAVA